MAAAATSLTLLKDQDAEPSDPEAVPGTSGSEAGPASLANEVIGSVGMVFRPVGISPCSLLEAAAAA